MFAMCHDFRIMREDRGYLGLPEILYGMPIPPGMMATIQYFLLLNNNKNLKSKNP